MAFEVIPVPAGSGWVMVVELTDVDPGKHEIAAMFADQHAEMAQEMADRLNLRRLANAPADFSAAIAELVEAGLIEFVPEGE